MTDVRTGAEVFAKMLSEFGAQPDDATEPPAPRETIVPGPPPNSAGSFGNDSSSTRR